MKTKIVEKVASKVGADYNPFLFQLAFLAALTSDIVDYIPVPGLDFLISAPLKALAVFLIWPHLGRGWPRVCRASLTTAVDLIAGVITFIEWITPITTVMVLVTWFMAWRKYNASQVPA